MLEGDGGAHAVGLLLHRRSARDPEDLVAARGETVDGGRGGAAGAGRCRADGTDESHATKTSSHAASILQMACLGRPLS